MDRRFLQDERLVGMSVALRSHPGGAPAAGVGGGLVPGGDPARWLAAIRACGGACGAMRLLVVPRSAADRRPSGLIVLAAAGEGEAARGDASRGGAGFGDGGRLLRAGMIPYRPHWRSKADGAELWLPADGRLEPGPPDAVLEECLPRASVCVWTPRSGLVGFERGDFLSLGDLLRVTAEEEAGWESPEVGVRLPSRLMGLAPLIPPDADDVLAAGGEGIADRTDRLGDVPPQPGESGALGRAAERIGRGMAEKLNRWFGGERGEAQCEGAGQGRGAGASGRAGGGWLAPLRRGLERQIEAARQKQLERLLRLMKTDPDRALRFALPLAGAAPRGFATPSARLSARLPDFSLRGLGGGGPADVWSVDPAMEIRLRGSYREQANRELHAGRYRRAAYIFAHLIGDLPAAASALEQGGYWNEAAVLYRKRLGRPRDAARCLACGGQTEEAAALYEEVQAFEELGDLWLAVGDAQRAAEAYRRQVDRLRSAGKVPAAARLLRERLEDEPAALEMLWDEWPGGRHRVACAELAFRWLGEAGAAAEAAERVERIAAGDRHKPPALDVAAVCSGVAAGFPHTGVRRAAEDACRMAVARGLEAAGHGEAESLVGHLVRCRANDRLLARDARRFLTMRGAAASSSGGAAGERGRTALRQAGRERPRLETLETVQLPPDFRYGALLAVGGQLLAAAARGNVITAFRISDAGWSAPSEQRGQVPGEGQPIAEEARLHAAWIMSGDGGQPAFILQPAGMKPALGAFSLADPERRGGAWQVSPMPPWWASVGEGQERQAVLAVAGDCGNGRWWLARRGAGIAELVAFGEDFEIEETHDLDAAILEYLESDSNAAEAARGLFEGELSMAVVRQQVWVAEGRLLLTIGAAGPQVVAELPQEARSLVGSPAGTAARLIVGYDEGFSVVWVRPGEALEMSHWEGIVEPRLAFVPGGSVVAVGADAMGAFSADGGRLHRRLDAAREGTPPVAVAAGGFATIAVLEPDGRLVRQRMTW